MNFRLQAKETAEEKISYWDMFILVSVRRRSWDNMLEVRHGLSWLPVCYTDWLEGIGYEICDMTGDG